MEESRPEATPSIRREALESLRQPGADASGLGVLRGDIVTQLQRTRGNRFVQSLVQRQPAAPKAGWSGSDVDSQSSNAAETTIGKMRRIPLQGLTEGNQSGNAVAETDELAAAPDQGRAIAVIPDNSLQAIDPKKPIEILLHLHGKNIGYRAREKAGGKLVGAGPGATAVGTVRDVSIDRIEAQLQSVISGSQRQMIAVLPQGTTGAGFGAKGFDSDAYLDQVFQMLVAGKFLPAGSARGPIIFSGHSGGGNTMIAAMANELAGSKTGSQLPANLGELLLFDAMNDDTQTPTVISYLQKRFKADAKNLSVLLSEADPVAKQLAYLSTSFRFRGIYSFSDYEARYQAVQTAINGWLGGLPGKLDKQVVRALKDNYKTFAAAVVTDPTTKKDKISPVEHDAIIGGNDNLERALARPTPQTSGATGGAKAASPTGSLESNQQSLDDQLAQAGQPPESEAELDPA